MSVTTRFYVALIFAYLNDMMSW